jgi:hypothetical protein
MEENYLIIEANVVTNIVVWDGGSDWTPPAGSIQLVQANTNAMTWVLSADKTTFVLGEVMGAGQIGFTWDGTILTTNQPQPPNPKPQPTTNGTTTA